mgnify:CR=1 FL=1
MSSHPPQLHDDEIKLHAIFQALRQQSVSVARGLSERISARLSEVESQRTTAPGLKSVLGSALVEFLNLLSGSVAPPEDEGDHEP